MYKSCTIKLVRTPCNNETFDQKIGLIEQYIKQLGFKEAKDNENNR